MMILLERPPTRLVFVPTQIVNFALVPPQFRFVLVSAVSLVWSASTVGLTLCIDHD